MVFRSKIFASLCLGCKVNRAESDSCSASLISSGWKIGDAENSELIIVNTCAVTHVADSKARKLVRSVCKKNINNNTVIVVSGCSSNLRPEVYSQIDKRIVVVKKVDLQSWINNNCLFEDASDISLAESSKVLASNHFRTRASIKIQDGCNNACTYCIVHVARGKSVSKNIDEIVSQARSMLESGIKEINLTGINLGNYYWNGFDLADLCLRLYNTVNEVFGDFDKSNLPARFRLGSIEPQDFSDKLISAIADCHGVICRHFHLPLQSGSEAVLKDMDRHYTAEGYLKLIQKIRCAMPYAAISTDVIVGFPGETEDQFTDSCELCMQCKMMKIHVFPYSKREGTPAAERNDQVDEMIKSKRVKKLQQLSNKLAAKDLEKRSGLSEFAIVENDHFARTESYHLISCDVREAGQLIKVNI